MEELLEKKRNLETELRKTEAEIEEKKNEVVYHIDPNKKDGTYFYLEQNGDTIDLCVRSKTNYSNYVLNISKCGYTLFSRIGEASKINTDGSGKIKLV